MVIIYNAGDNSLEHGRRAIGDECEASIICNRRSEAPTTARDLRMLGRSRSHARMLVHTRRISRTCTLVANGGMSAFLRHEVHVMVSSSLSSFSKYVSVSPDSSCFIILKPVSNVFLNS